MNTNEQKPQRSPERPESQPHGTTSDQIAEMESEGGQAGQVGQAVQVGKDKRSVPQPAAQKR